MSCLTCKHRKLACDQYRPRCAPCRRSHLKCRYDPSTISLQFHDETDNVKAHSSQRKRRKSTYKDNEHSKSSESGTPTVVDSTASENTLFSGDLDQLWSSSHQDPAFWNAGLFDSTSLDTLDASQFWQDIADAAMFPDPVVNINFGTIEPSSLISSESLFTAPSVEPLTQTLDASKADGQQLESIPDYILAQYYTSNLTTRYSSKERGWNYYTYFYNRFTNTHPFVVSALFAWTSAHLFFSGTLKSFDHVVKHYQKCIHQICLSHDIGIFTTSDGRLEVDELHGVMQLSADDLDAIVVSLYFLASTDSLAARPRELRTLLRITTNLISLQRDRDPEDGLSFEVCNWFCFLDARASAFGMGDSSLITALGGKEGLLNAQNHSRGFLRKEYKMLYPADLIVRDAAHLPLNEIIIRLIATFGEISKYYDHVDETLRRRTRLTLDDVKTTLYGFDESASSKNRVLSTLFTTKAMFHAVEIYFSRASLPEAPLYAADADALAVIRITEKLYRTLGRPITDPPTTKFWPIPLVMASIESKDPIYRDWALRKIIDYKLAGEVYCKSVEFVQRILEMEGKSGVRAHLGEIMKGMANAFVL